MARGKRKGKYSSWHVEILGEKPDNIRMFGSAIGLFKFIARKGFMFKGKKLEIHCDGRIPKIMEYSEVVSEVIKYENTPDINFLIYEEEFNRKITKEMNK